MNVGRLLFPAIRWSAEHGFLQQWNEIEHSLALGVGGFIIFGGEAGAVRELTQGLTSRVPYPLLIGADLERGAGQQFQGATPLPPAAAFGVLDEPETTRRAAELTAREARALGINWIYSPDADVDLEPENPIIGTRAFGSNPARVANQVVAWVQGCRDGGALSCAKHFPGHGRTASDSHVVRPTVSVDRHLLEMDLAPFRAAVQAGVDSMMTAHISYPALDPSGAPATLSFPILNGLLRHSMGFKGIVVTDAIIMDGLTEDATEATASVGAVAAGCDALLYPSNPAAVIVELQAALRDGRLSQARVGEALDRVRRFAEQVPATPSGQWGREADRSWALETAVRTLQVVRGHPSITGGAVHLIEIEDDLGGPYPPYPRTALPAALHRAGVELHADGTPLVAVYSDIRAWKGRPSLSDTVRDRVIALTTKRPDATVILFGHPRVAEEIPSTANVLAAWGGEALMQEAAVAWLTGVTDRLHSVAAGLDQ